MTSDDFNSGSEPRLELIYNMIFVLSLEYDTVTELNQKECGQAKDMATHKPLCYYVMNDGFDNEDKAIFKRHDMAMQ